MSIVTRVCNIGPAGHPLEYSRHGRGTLLWNVDAYLSKFLRTLYPLLRLFLTGTPLQIDPKELWP
ncbi:hypothetical protein BGZ91_000294, partial [Linnemannia elongata]